MLLFAVSGLLVSAAPAAADSLKVVATTEWTAALCHIAGIEDVDVLAPAYLQHPPDYALRPSDIPRIMEADIIVYGGYEGMMQRIRSNLADSETNLLKVTTVNSEAIVRDSALAIAEAAGTEAAAESNLEELHKVWEEARAMVEASGLNWKQTAVHFFLGDFAWTMGLFEVASFGPAPPGPGLIAELAGSGAELIVDNAHKPLAASFREVLPEAVVVELINFPGTEGTETLEDVILHNAKVLAAAAE